MLHFRMIVAGFLLVLVTACASTPPDATTQSADAPGAQELPSAQPNDQSPVQQAMTANLDTQSGLNVRAQHIAQALESYYRTHDNQPAWFDDEGKPRMARIDALGNTLSHADRQGLIDDDYGISALAAHLRDNANEDARDAPATLVQADLQLSRALLGYAVDLHDGRVFDDRVRTQWVADAAPTDYAAVLERAVARDSDNPIDAALAELAPPHAGYTQLVAALAEYRSIEAAGGWPRIPAGALLKVGMRDPRVPALRTRLRITGDWPGQGGPQVPPVAVSKKDRSTLFDKQTSQALAHYQTRNGLNDDGRLGDNTLAVLNVTAADRVAQIELNLERWRWLPADLGERYVLVNIPDYQLTAFDHGDVALRMNVIVGDSYDNRATPVFADIMRYIIFRPFWNVPHGIAVKEILPKARADHGYLASRRYQIVRVFGPNAKPMAVTDANLDAVEAGRANIRQEGGPSNALGLIKFMFPNEYAVYLHSTPGAQLFSRTERDLSHGCVRVADPEALALFALAGKPEWTPKRIHDAMHTGDWDRVNLAEPLPVYLMYWTAFVNDDGVQFRTDLYQHDQRLRQAMQAAQPSDSH